MHEQAAVVLALGTSTKFVVTRCTDVAEELALFLPWAIWEDVPCWHVMVSLFTGDPSALVLFSSLAAPGIAPQWAQEWNGAGCNGDLGPGLC